MSSLNLREQAEIRVADGRAAGTTGDTAEGLVHELQVHAVELQMQNEELQAALIEQEAAHMRAGMLIRSVLDSIGDFVAILDHDGTISTVNTHWREFSMANSATPGVETPNAGIGANYLRVCEACIALTADPYALKARDGIVAVMRGQLPAFNLEYPCHAPDALRWFKLSVTPLDAPGGGVVTAHHDITARKLLEEEQRIAAIAFESQQCFMLTDAQGLIVRVNRAFVELTGYSADEAVGQRPAILGSGRQDRDFYAQMWKSLTESGAWQGEIWNRRKDGRTFVASVTISAVRGAGGATTHYLASYLDNTVQKEAALEIQRLENYDALTGLPNRRSLNVALGRAIADGATSGRHGALLLLDLDHFKNLNDTMGHAAGDRFLVDLAGHLANRIRECDTLVRNGGDEFALVLPDLGDDPQEAATHAGAMADILRNAIAQPFSTVVEDFRSTASVGIAVFGSNDASAENLMKNADLALNQAKAAGPDHTQFFEVGLQTTLLECTRLESDLRRAMSAGQFHLEYQPQVDHCGRVVGAEALLRWSHPTRGLVPPNEFIALAEESGLILPIGAWVLQTAIQSVADWSADPLMKDLRLAVNVSAKQIHQADFVEQVMHMVAERGADPSRLKIELTESVVLHDIDDTLKKMRALKSLGIGFSLDDFGTGYSSLAYLTRLPLDQLKIDRSFVRNLPDGRNDAVMAQTIIAMATGLGLGVISEGVETGAQRDFLEQHGCHVHQGYLFSRSLPLSRFVAFVHASAARTEPPIPVDGV